MKYTKEQAEMLALLVVMGCAIVVLSFLYLVKPNFAAIATCKKEMKKTEAEITKLRDAAVQLAKAKNEKDALTETIERGEKAVFSGLEGGPPLTEVCVQAARALNPKPAYGDQTNKQLLEFVERGADGSQATRHYDEVSRTLEVHSVDFFALCRFLSAVEKANEGLMVAHLEIDTAKLDPQVQGKGKVDAKFELSMVGIREGQPPTGFDVSGYQDFAVGEKRNPFGQPEESLASGPDPLAGPREALNRTKIEGVWADVLLVKFPVRVRGGQETFRRVRMSKGETTVIEGTKMKYVGGAGDTFVFEATEHGVRFILETNWKGEVKTFKEEEAK